MNQILRRQTSRSHYGSKVPAVTVTWKTLFIDQYNKYGADRKWMLHQYVLSKVASHFNRFWTDIVQNWGKLRERYSESDDIPINILTQSIWFNKKLKIDNTIFLCFFFIINGASRRNIFYKWFTWWEQWIPFLQSISRNLWDRTHLFTVYGNFTYDTTNLEG